MKGRRIVFGPSDLSTAMETAGMSADARYGVLHDELVRRLEFHLGSKTFQDEIAELLDATIEAATDAGYDQTCVEWHLRD